MSIAYGERLLDVSGPKGAPTNAVMEDDLDNESEKGSIRQVRNQRDGRGNGMLKWLGLNAIRIVGVVAISWAIGVQLILLVK